MSLFEASGATAFMVFGFTIMIVIAFVRTLLKGKT